MTIRARLLHFFLPRFPQHSHQKQLHLMKKKTPGAHCTSTWLSHGLTSALLVDESAPLPPLRSTFRPLQYFRGPLDPLTEPFIRSRKSEVVTVNFLADFLAFQTDSALEKMTGGSLKAVPQFVRGPIAGHAVARNTLAVFTRPNMKESWI